MKGLTKKHVTRRHSQQCGDRQREGGHGSERDFAWGDAVPRGFLELYA